MKYRDMPSTTGDGTFRQPSMRCADCLAGPYSAERGDYFWADPEDVVTCGECGGEMELGREETRWIPA